MTIQFSGKEFTFIQPDGTKIQVRGWGDQYAAMFRTLDGRPVVRNPLTGFYEYAEIDSRKRLRPRGLRMGLEAAPVNFAAESEFTAAETKSLILSNPGLPRGTTRWQVRRERKRLPPESVRIGGMRPLPPKRTTTGQYVGLCLLIDFEDDVAQISQEEVEAFLNRPGYQGFGNNGSVRDYFLDISAQKLDYQTIVPAYYRAKYNKAHYSDRKVAQPQRAYDLIVEALEHLAKNQFDFKQLTADSEGYIYAINVYYAGQCWNDWSEGLWPHSFHLADPIELVPGRKAYDYQFTNMGEELTLGTYCHENGHMLCDFPDLYDYGYESAGVGAYCLMCGGANSDPKNPVHVSAYLKYRAGWATAITKIKEPISATLPAGQNDFFIFEKSSREYFILENRQQKERDVSLPDAGLAIWHIDENGDNSHEHGTSLRHYECALIQADGRRDLENNVDGDAEDLYPSPINGEFSADTNPRSHWWNGKKSGLRIFDIVDSGTAVTFKVEV